MVTSRIWFTAAEKAELWERWKRGSSAAAISRARATGLAAKAMARITFSRKKKPRR